MDESSVYLCFSTQNKHTQNTFLQQFFHEHVEIDMYVLLTDFTQLFSDMVSKGCNEIKW